MSLSAEPAGPSSSSSSPLDDSGSDALHDRSSSTAGAAQRPKPRLWMTAAASSTHPSDDSPPPSPPFHTRLGAEYQARLPPLMAAAALLPPQPRAEREAGGFTAAAEMELDGDAVWQPSRAPDDAAVEAYLSSVQALFAEKPDDYDEETALLFLHRCGYDVGLALSLIQPHSASSSSSSAFAADSGSHSYNSSSSLACPSTSPAPSLSPRSDSDSSLSSPDPADTDDVCSVCMDGGTLIICERRGCHRVYHCECAGLRGVPGGRWECPLHSCHACGEEWSERRRRKRQRKRQKTGDGGIGAAAAATGTAVGSEQLKPVSAHASLINSHSHPLTPHLLSPAASSSAASASSALASEPSTAAPPAHIACFSCPTAYCLHHIPAAVSAYFNIPLAALSTLTSAELSQYVGQSSIGCFLCLSCMHVQERRERLRLLRLLDSAMDGKREPDALSALYAALKGQDAGDSQAGDATGGEREAALAAGGEERESCRFEELLHHPTEWKRIERTLAVANSQHKRSSTQPQQQQLLDRAAVAALAAKPEATSMQASMTEMELE